MVQIPGGSLHCTGGRSQWTKVVPVSLTPVFSKYFCLCWSNPGSWNWSLPVLVDEFLTPLCNSEMKNAKELFLAFTEESEFSLQSWLNFLAILYYET